MKLNYERDLNVKGVNDIYIIIYLLKRWRGVGWRVVLKSAREIIEKSKKIFFLVFFFKI
jgi:hypothetical protein